MLGHAAMVGGFGIHMFVTIIIAGILYSQGDIAARFVTRFATRLANQRGAEAVKLAGLAIRAVALGIVVTAGVAATLGGGGFWGPRGPPPRILAARDAMVFPAPIRPPPPPPRAGGMVFS